MAASSKIIGSSVWIFEKSAVAMCISSFIFFSAGFSVCSMNWEDTSSVSKEAIFSFAASFFSSGDFSFFSDGAACCCVYSSQ